MAATTSITAVGVYNIGKPNPNQTVTQIAFSPPSGGAYTGFSFTVNASIDGTNYGPIACVRKDQNLVVNGTNTISPSNSSVFLLDVPSAGFGNVQINVTALGSGTVVMTYQSESFVSPALATSVTTGNVISSSTTAGTITVANTNALAVGPNGTTNPTFNVNTNTGSAATGISVVGAAAASGVEIQVTSSGTNEALNIDAKAAAAIVLNGQASTATGVQVGSSTAAAGTVLNVVSSSASAVTVGPNGATNPVLQVNANTASAATGIKVTGAAAASGIALQAISSGSNEAITIDAKAAALITLAGTASTATGVNVGSATSAANAVLTVVSSNASALAVGANGATNPALQINANTASSATGLKITSAAAAGGVAVAAISSGNNEALTVDAKGSGAVKIGANSTGGVQLGAGVSGGPAVIVPGTLTAGGLLTAAIQVATSGPLIYSGSGAPTISAAVKGSIYLRSDGSSTSTRMYVAEDTAGTWASVTTSA